MKVVLTYSFSGLRDGVPWPAKGETVDLTPDEAEQYVANGWAAKPEDYTPPTPGPIVGASLEAAVPAEPEVAAVATEPAPARKAPAKKSV